MGVNTTFHQQARRRQLVDVAIELIGEGGLPAASNVAIARRAGVSRGVVNYNVGAREELIRLVVARVYELGREAVLPSVSAAADPVEALRAFATASLDFYVERPAEMRALREVFADPELVDRVSTAEHRGEIDDLVRIVDDGQRAGTVVAGEPTLLIALVRAALDWGAAAVAAGAAVADVRESVLAVVERTVVERTVVVRRDSGPDPGAAT